MKVIYFRVHNKKHVYTKAKTTICALLLSLVLLTNNVDAKGINPVKAGKYIGKKIVHQLDEGEKERAKNNREYLRIKKNIQDGKKISKKDQVFYDYCQDRIKGYSREWDMMKKLLLFLEKECDGVITLPSGEKIYLDEHKMPLILPSPLPMPLPIPVL